MRRYRLRARCAPGPPAPTIAKIATGEIEIAAAALEVLNMAEVLPFPVDDPEIARTVNEELRLQYRYLDLRRPEMARNLRLRSQVGRRHPRYMDGQGFVEVETPILIQIHARRRARIPRSQPPRGGDVLRPAAIAPAIQTNAHGGRRGTYYQIARCFRDEDQRADRQLEFTQLDLEMSFIEREDIYALVEGLSCQRHLEAGAER